MVRYRAVKVVAAVSISPSIQRYTAGGVSGTTAVYACTLGWNV